MPVRIFSAASLVNCLFTFSAGAAATSAAYALTPALFMQAVTFAISLAAIFVTVGLYVASVRTHDKEIERQRVKIEEIEKIQAGRNERLASFDVTMLSMHGKQVSLEKSMKRTLDVAADLAKSLAVIQSICDERCRAINESRK